MGVHIASWDFHCRYTFWNHERFFQLGTLVIDSWKMLTWSYMQNPKTLQFWMFRNGCGMLGEPETPKSVLHPCSTHQPTGEHLKCRSKSESALLNVDQVAVSETSNHPIVAQLLPKKSNKSNNYIIGSNNPPNQSWSQKKTCHWKTIPSWPGWLTWARWLGFNSVPICEERTWRSKHGVNFGELLVYNVL